MFCIDLKTRRPIELAAIPRAKITVTNDATGYALHARGAAILH